jgi:hypothetical protein
MQRVPKKRKAEKKKTQHMLQSKAGMSSSETKDIQGWK